jgi:hypothetical protein
MILRAQEEPMRKNCDSLLCDAGRKISGSELSKTKLIAQAVMALDEVVVAAYQAQHDDIVRILSSIRQLIVSVSLARD